jgi:hypothetical protein
MHAIPIQQNSGIVLENSVRCYQKAESGTVTMCQLITTAEHNHSMTKHTAKVSPSLQKNIIATQKRLHSLCT